MNRCLCLLDDGTRCDALGGCGCHPDLCQTHYNDVFADRYRSEQYRLWSGAGRRGTTSGWGRPRNSRIGNPIVADHQCADAVHRGVATVLCGGYRCSAGVDGQAACNTCSTICLSCGQCDECSSFCREASSTYCCECQDEHHCTDCNGVIPDTECVNGFRCSSCCDCAEQDEDRGYDEGRSSSQSSVPYSLDSDWYTIKARYIGECKACKNSMIACVCVDY